MSNGKKKIALPFMQLNFGFDAFEEAPDPKKEDDHEKAAFSNNHG